MLQDFEVRICERSMQHSKHRQNPGPVLDLHRVPTLHVTTGYAGDVWNQQPPPEDHPWRKMPNHGMTPHYSGTTLDAQVGLLHPNFLNHHSVHAVSVLATVNDLHSTHLSPCKKIYLEDTHALALAIVGEALVILCCIQETTMQHNDAIVDVYCRNGMQTAPRPCCKTGLRRSHSLTSITLSGRVSWLISISEASLRHFGNEYGIALRVAACQQF